ncbi:MAG: hypothetical protein K2Z81_14220 [Cyanobacteria bacterium]|nr:hypothetical protein [Cyanobacteriota bacterium]
MNSRFSSPSGLASILSAKRAALEGSADFTVKYSRHADNKTDLRLEIIY